MINNSNKLVSIIITTYNRGDFLIKRSIPSVFNQTHNNCEFIVVDDCSIDNTESLIRKIGKQDKRVKYFKTPANGGISVARNLGIRKSKGDFIAFLDDEDEFLPLFVEEALKAFSNSSEKVAGLVPSMIIRYEGGREIVSTPTEIFWKTGMGNGWIFRKSVFLKSSLSFNENLRSLEDLDFSLRFGEKFIFHVLKKPLFRYYTSAPKFNFKSPLGDKRYKDYLIKDLTAVFNQNLFFYKTKGKKELAWFYFFVGIHYCQFSKIKEGRRMLLKSFFIYPALRTLYNLLGCLMGYKAFLILFGFKSKIRELFH